MQSLGFSDAVKKLSQAGIRGNHIYLIDLVLLCEMAWADGEIQEGEREILFSYLNRHIESINRLAGCRVLEQKEAREFLVSFLETRPAPKLLETIEEVIAAIRLDKYDATAAERTCLDILNGCLDIAASSVTQYPYGLSERFTEEEKVCYHKLARMLAGNTDLDNY